MKRAIQIRSKGGTRRRCFDIRRSWNMKERFKKQRYPVGTYERRFSSVYMGRCSFRYVMDEAFCTQED